MDAKEVDAATVEKVRSICVSFLDGDWITKNDCIRVERLLSGNANRTFRVSLDQEKVIVKLYGSEMIERVEEVWNNNLSEEELRNVKNVDKDNGVNVEAATAVLMWILYEQQLAPKLFGVFSGGRIEEYISGRNLLISDFEDKELYSMAARTLATFNHIRAPVPKKNNYLNLFTQFLNLFPNECDYSAIDAEYRDAVKELLAFPLFEETRWIQEWSRKLRFKLVFSHNDLHFGNIILKSEYDSPENRLMFVDYDLCGYNYRGSDIAYFLQSFEFNVFAGVDHISFNYTGNKCDPQMKRYFAESYLTEAKKFTDIIDPELDTVDFLLMEIEFFTLQAYLVFLMFSKMMIFDPKKEKALDHILTLIRCFKEQKQLFCSKYGHLLKSD